MNRLQGKTALITGAGSGLGLATAQCFAQEGARVVLTDIDHARVQAEAARLSAAGHDAVVLAHDVTRESDWDRVIAAAGALDVLVNNAGVGRLGNVEQASLQDWRAVLEINLDGVFLGTQKAIAAMKGRGGSIINVSSIEGLIGEPNLAAYNASKGGVRLLTKSAALHCAAQGYGIRVNSLHPGYIATPMVTGALAALPADVAQALQADIVSRIPLGRLARAEEIAPALVFMASDESRYMTGAELVIDGGYTAR
ncbi:MAG: 3-beta hydroxysteroid dehydrogenase [Comamonadaceae bacterium SCN 68-20]|nr:glucose 1-dehydrogenase [Comamonadaceae bacterium]ODU61046.1 MAG: 3-beta hydroxysteroid dehydrogenase [Comamonadaceae bacterium SCN 68-20]OJX29590.1 MAG: 3-beta hydroxysteroid dehydrogenase [Burkholderiales bacterium 68-20]